MQVSYPKLSRQSAAGRGSVAAVITGCARAIVVLVGYHCRVVALLQRSNLVFCADDGWGFSSWTLITGWLGGRLRGLSSLEVLVIACLARDKPFRYCGQLDRMLSSGNTSCRNGLAVLPCSRVRRSTSGRWFSRIPPIPVSDGAFMDQVSTGPALSHVFVGVQNTVALFLAIQQ